MLAQTDIQAGFTNFYTKAWIQITRLDAHGTTNHAAIMDLRGGTLAPGNANNNGGDYGYLLWGVRGPGGIFWFQPERISAFNCIFLPPVKNCTWCRVWLKPGVHANVNIEAESKAVEYLTKVVNAILPYIISVAAAKSTANPPLIGGTKQLPVPANP